LFLKHEKPNIYIFRWGDEFFWGNVCLMFFNISKKHFENLFFTTLFFLFFIIFFNIVDHEMNIKVFLMFCVNFEKILNDAKERKEIYFFECRLTI